MNIEPQYDFQKVLDAVHPQIEQLVMALFPDARRQGQSFRIGSAQGESGKSFSISTRSNNAGSFIDHADQEVSGNAIGLVALSKGMNYKAAGKWLAEFLNVAPEPFLHVKRKREEPIIETSSIGELNQRSIQFSKTRGIEESVLRQLNCKSTSTHIVFPHFDVEENLVMQKFWSCDDKKNIYCNKNPISVLFGKEMIDPIKSGGRLVICEGQWDAMTWLQLGIPAVSIPNGVDNDDWISEDWIFLNQFHEIYLNYDGDQQGVRAQDRVRVRLGYERCKSIKLKYKDANDALKEGDIDELKQSWENAKHAPVERVIDPRDLKDAVRKSLLPPEPGSATPFCLSGMRFEFRPHELTFWFGLTSHGKSTLLMQQICFAASLNESSLVASFETLTSVTLGAAMLQYTGNADIGTHDDYDAAYDDIAGKVLFYNSMSRSNPDEVIATIMLAHKRYGITHAVIDNVMTLDVDRQDNTSQAAVADKFRLLASKIPIHVHLVGHPRKPDASGAEKPPSIYEARGAAEWVDMAHNVIVVWRDTGKAAKISSMHDEGIDKREIYAFDESVPDGRVIVRKQRLTGDLPMCSYRFCKLTKRAFKVQEDLHNYWTP